MTEQEFKNRGIEILEESFKTQLAKQHHRLNSLNHRNGNMDLNPDFSVNVQPEFFFGEAGENYWKILVNGRYLKQIYPDSERESVFIECADILYQAKQGGSNWLISFMELNEETRNSSDPA